MVLPEKVQPLDTYEHESGSNIAGIHKPSTVLIKTDRKKILTVEQIVKNQEHRPV